MCKTEFCETSIVFGISFEQKDNMAFVQKIN